MNKGWLELESDPGLFTLLLEDFGVNGVQVEEIYDLQKPIEGTVYGFIFLFRWIEERRSRRKTNSEVESFVTDAEAVNKIFFAQQIIPNSCATHALLSVLLNCSSKVKLGKTLNLIKEFTDCMSPEDKGYAIANMPELARVHNSFARPETKKPVQEKQTGLSSVRAMDSETFHFVSYVPIHGRLFELDGLKPYPIDHGPWEKGDDWTEKFRRVITDRLGMATGGEPYHDIRFNLMAVVPDKRQLLEHKLATLKINRNIVLEALQQVVSPTSSERSDSEGTPCVKETKKSVTFSSDVLDCNEKVNSPAAANILASSASSSNMTSSTSSAVAVKVTSTSSSSSSHHPSSILKAGTTAVTSVDNSNAVLPERTEETVVTDSPSLVGCDVTHASHSAPVSETADSSSNDNSDCKDIVSATIAATEEVVISEGDDSAVNPPQLAVTEEVVISDSVDLEIKTEPVPEMGAETMIVTDDHSLTIANVEEVSSGSPLKVEEVEEVKPGSNFKVEDIKIPFKTESSEASIKTSPTIEQQLGADLTKPLSIETKFNVSPGAASNESTDTASEIGSGFSSPGSLNTSDSQSSPQFSDGNSGEVCEDRRTRRRKRKSSHAFTPKDLLCLLKNVEHEIEVCNTNLKEENEKRKKYKIDACRRTHNYDQFIVTFLSMLAEQGLLGELMEENIAVKRPGAANNTSSHGSSSGAKVAKKSSSSSSQQSGGPAIKKKTTGKIKKKGKK